MIKIATRIGQPSSREPTTASAANAMRKAAHMLDGYPAPPRITGTTRLRRDRSGATPLAPSVAGVTRSTSLEEVEIFDDVKQCSLKLAGEDDSYE